MLRIWSTYDPSIKEDFALAIPEKDAPFFGTEKDGELMLQNPRINPVSRDIWLDPRTLRYLRYKTFEEGASAQERDRVQHRAKGYYFMNKLLKKRTSPLTGKIDKVVPPPRERTNLSCAIHIEAGHFGFTKLILCWNRPTFEVECLRRSARKFFLARFAIM
jgi:hypothetical protein